MMRSYQFSQQIQLGRRLIGPEQPSYIIAEAGVNHNGDMAMAHQLIDVAVAAGADAVKFQLFSTEALIRSDVVKASYQLQGEGDAQSQFQMLKQLEISPAQCRQLQHYCAQHGIEFLVTPFDEPSLEQLKEAKLSALKISSTDLTNLPFLVKAASLKIPLIVSTGMSEYSEVQRAVDTLYPHCKDLILLQCTSSYPAPDSALNLRVMQSFQQQFQLLVGYSDHTVGLGASPYAVAAGAVLVEKHFTLDKSLPGPDHQASLSPEELRQFVAEIRRVDAMLGSAVKSVEWCERANRASLQKSMVAACRIEAGEPFTAQNLVARRTGGIGVSPVYAEQLYRLCATRNYDAGDIIDG
ncbi:N-acetylneuraminate synthase family protein [Alkalimonas amylolytica]|uniref:N-acetylneuraminate synthase n=1 Tax=Alkalimonas amylolytica TaxID=152573 RepID=A0A1H4B8E0_ALKAM|nr:N-acetylneuraminate synthase family protein [Alkalimonas amylolytica]SEA44409.1 N-acetylneuraminate synthase [Alkalimonas amylolytica]